MMNMDKPSERIIGVVQARMESSRLPGKVLAEILGKPLIWHIVNRMSYVKTLANIVIATTDKHADKPLREFAQSENIPFYAGSENDILDRLYQSGKKFNATALLKINADCPFVDPEIIDLAVNRYLKMSTKPDLIVNSVTNTYPEGLQYGLFNFKTLCEIWQDLEDPFWRESIYAYIIENRKKYSVINIENNKNLSSLRWTVDYEEDLEFVREVYGHIFIPNKPFLMSDVLLLLKKNPTIQKINAKYHSNLGREEYERLKKKHDTKSFL